MWRPSHGRRIACRIHGDVPLPRRHRHIHALVEPQVRTPIVSNVKRGSLGYTYVGVVSVLGSCTGAPRRHLAREREHVRVTPSRSSLEKYYSHVVAVSFQRCCIMLDSGALQMCAGVMQLNYPSEDAWELVDRRLVEPDSKTATRSSAGRCGSPRHPSPFMLDPDSCSRAM